MLLVYTQISEVYLYLVMDRFMKISLQSLEQIQLSVLNYPHAQNAVILGGDLRLSSFEVASK